MMTEMKNVLDLLENSAKSYGDKTAFIDYDKKVTYAQLVAKSKAVATFILSKNLRNRPIIVLTRRDIESVILLLGVLYSGNIYLPMDCSQPSERIISVLEIIDNNVVLCKKSDTRIGENYKDVCFLTLEEIDENVIDFDSIDKIRQDIIDTDPMCCFLTSGTTGKPKGVLKSHQNIISMVKIFTEKFDFSQEDVFGCQASFDFDVSNKPFFISLYLGATVFIIPNSLFVFSGRLIPTLNQNKVSVLIWSVSALSLLAKIRIMKNEKPKFVNKIMFSGEAISYLTIKYWKDNLKDTLFVNLYGPTEMTGNALCYEVDAISENMPVPMGKSLPDTRVYLMDKNQHLITEKNINGEIYISGKCLAMCYYNDIKKTSEVFIQNPFNKSYPEIIYRTGDIGYINDDGNYVFVGRSDFQIKRNGYRIELSEIEEAVNNSSIVSLCCCVYNKDQNKMYLYYQSDCDCNQKLYELLKRKVSAYMIPDILIRLDGIPLNSHDKIDREVLMKNENECVL